MEDIYTINEKPNAIPYRISYYKHRWDFCVEMIVKYLLEKSYIVLLNTNLIKEVE